MSKEKAVTVSDLADSLMAKFVEAFRSGIRSFQDAGDTLAKLVEVDPDALERLQKVYGIQPSISRRFLDIGRGKLLPQLFDQPNYIRALPVADQQRLVEGKVEALVLKPDGSADPIRVDIMSAPVALVRQVVGCRGLRSLSEQRAALVTAANANLSAKEARGKTLPPMPWHVVGKTIVVTAGVTLTQKDLAAMMQAIS